MTETEKLMDTVRSLEECYLIVWKGQHSEGSKKAVAELRAALTERDELKANNEKMGIQIGQYEAQIERLKTKLAEYVRRARGSVKDGFLELHDVDAEIEDGFDIIRDLAGEKGGK